MKRRKQMAVKGLLKKMEVKVSDEYDQQTDDYDINPLNNKGEYPSIIFLLYQMLPFLGLGFRVKGFRVKPLLRTKTQNPLWSPCTPHGSIRV
jgi:hypothetical protein